MIFVCESCGRATFPRRLLCPECGGREFREERVDAGTLEDVADRGEVKVGIVRVAQGPVLVARVEGDAARGAQVRLEMDGEVPVARA